MMTFLEALSVQRPANRSDSAIHHVGRGNDVGPGTGVRQRLPHQQVEGSVVLDLAVLDDAAVAVVGVLAQAGVGDHQQVRGLVLDGPYGFLHHAAVGVSFRAYRILGLGDAKQDHARDAQAPDDLGLPGRAVHRELRDAGHGGDGLLLVPPRADEQRIDEVPRTQRGLAHEIAQQAGPSKSSWPGYGKCHGCLLSWRPSTSLRYAQDERFDGAIHDDPVIVESTNA